MSDHFPAQSLPSSAAPVGSPDVASAQDALTSSSTTCAEATSIVFDNDSYREEQRAKSLERHMRMERHRQRMEITATACSTSSPNSALYQQSLYQQ